MSAIVKLVQGTPKWHDHRARSRNASETPAVLGVSPWQTPYGLWLLRTGRKVQEVTPAMQHGSELEPAARAAYEKLTGTVMEPLVLTDGDYSASLDGITLGGELILEIKCPFKGRASELWKSVAAGEVPAHYWWQVQHQLMVVGAALAHLYVFDGTEGLLLDVTPKPETWSRITKAWDEFQRYLASDSPPPLTDKDVRLSMR
jgi:putative phage-type endonuclease